MTDDNGTQKNGSGNLNRRNFLRNTGLAAGTAGLVGMGSLAGCAGPQSRDAERYEDQGSVNVTIERVDRDASKGERWAGDSIRENPRKPAFDIFIDDTLAAIERVRGNEGLAQEVAASLVEQDASTLLSQADQYDNDLHIFMHDTPVHNGNVDEAAYIYRLVNFTGMYDAHNADHETTTGMLLSPQVYDFVAGVAWNNMAGDIASHGSNAALVNQAHLLHELDPENPVEKGFIVKDGRMHGDVEEMRQGMAHYHSQTVSHELFHNYRLPHLTGFVEMDAAYDEAQGREKLRDMDVDWDDANEEIIERYGNTWSLENQPPYIIDATTMAGGYAPLFSAFNLRSVVTGNRPVPFRIAENEHGENVLIDDWRVHNEPSEDSLAYFSEQAWKEAKENAVTANPDLNTPLAQAYQAGPGGGTYVVNDPGMYDSEPAMQAVLEQFGQVLADERQKVSEPKKYF